MSEDLEHRLKRAMARIPVDVAELARKTGLTYQGIKKAYDGKTKNMELDSATAIAKALGCNKHWLASGEGDPAFDMQSAVATAATAPHETTATNPSANLAPVVTEYDSGPPDGYIRLEHLSPRPAMGQGAAIDEIVHVVRQIDVLEQWVRQKVGATDPARVKILTGSGHSMRPTIQDQDLVFVDTYQTTIDTPGIYVVNVYDRLLLKRALILSDGTLILRSDNTEEFPDEERYDLQKSADSIQIAGKVKAWWTLRH